jgi:cytochrome c1
MEWARESVRELIELYKRKEIIWDPKHPMHFNKVRKQDAWEELGKEMNRPVDECKKKMENLLSYLRWAKMKMRKSSGIGKVEY